MLYPAELQGRGRYETWRETSAPHPQPATSPSYGAANRCPSLGSGWFSVRTAARPAFGRADAARKGRFQWAQAAAVSGGSLLRWRWRCSAKLLTTRA